MYADYYGLREPPFALTPDTGYFYMHRAQREALNVLLVALTQGEGLLKVVGEVGTGKTLLCRKLLSSLGPDFYTAYLPNPALPPNVLRRALAAELEIAVDGMRDQHTLTQSIYQRLIELAGAGRRVVLLVDEAQTLPEQSLEALRLLTNLETEKQKLLQIVLFGQPELDVRLRAPALRQVLQRVAFSCELRPLAREEVAGYISHRLAAAGFRGRPLFLPGAVRAIYHASRGVPRLINLICNKALLLAYGRGDQFIRRRYVRRAAGDTEGAASQPAAALRRPLGVGLGAASAALVAGGAYLLAVLP